MLFASGSAGAAVPKGVLPNPISTRRLVYAAKLVARGVAIPEALERNMALFDDDAVAALRATLKAVL